MSPYYSRFENKANKKGEKIYQLVILSIKKNPSNLADFLI